jgi:hypothetical protein
MPADLNREDILALLNKLGSADDAEVLGTARELNRQVKAAGVSWDALLASDTDDDDDDDDAVAYSVSDDETVLVAPNADHGGLNDADKAEARTLIDAIGALKVSDTTRDELADYAADLLENRMEQMDLRYLRALKKRLDR